jgi:hypothetical protein
VYSSICPDEFAAEEERYMRTNEIDRFDNLPTRRFACPTVRELPASASPRGIDAASRHDSQRQLVLASLLRCPR